MKISLYPLFVLLLLATAARGQGFIKNYLPASSVFKAVVDAPGGGYFVAGSTVDDNSLFLQRVDSNGTVLWAQHLQLNGAQAIAACPAADSGFVVLAEFYATAQGYRNIALKISKSGATVWQTQINNNLLANGLRDIIQTSDGQFLAAGDTRNAQLEQNVWLVKLGAGGNLLWSRSLGDSVYNEQVNRLLELPNGHIVVSGAGVHGTDRDLFLMKTEADGTPIWEKWYAQPHTQNAHDLLQLSDGGLAVLADTYGENPGKLAILRTDGDGVEDFFQETSIGLSDLPNTPVNVLSGFATDAANNFFVPIGSAEVVSASPGVALLWKFDAFATFEWAKSLSVSGLPQRIIRTPTGAFVVVGSNNDDQGAFLIKTDQEGEIYTNKLSGEIFLDQNDNCVLDNGEPPLNQFIVQAVNQAGEKFYQTVAANGAFLIPVPNGNFTVSIAPRFGAEGFWIACDPAQVLVSGSHLTLTVPPLGMRSVADCPLLDVEIASTTLRRCTTAVLNVNYCNNGNLTASDVSIQVTLDPKMTYQSSTIPPGSLNNGILIFNVPDLVPGDCASFNVNVLVECSAEIGEVMCTEAHIFPDSSCLPPNPSWDGSNLVVSGTCNGQVEFNIRNTGPGNMTGQVDYVIIEDQIMYMQGKVQLNADEDTTIQVPSSSGHSYVLLANQRIGHPGKSSPTAFVEQCGGGAPSNLALQIPQDAADPFISVWCDQVVSSYDPNDKRGFPLGWQAAHFIEPDQDLEYMIRFQNTGNDTAFQVVIRDTITDLLDISSLRPGPSSHPYTYAVSGTGAITFRFEHILLPDSNVNEAASHGYVMFRLRQRPGLALGEVIENRAGIYFDFNPPVITNTSFHTIGHPLLSATVDHPAVNDLDLQVYPNPMGDQVTFQVGGFTGDSRFQLALFNVQGKLIREENFAGPDFHVQRDRLLPGIYFFQLTEKSGRTARGKIVVR